MNSESFDDIGALLTEAGYPNRALDESSWALGINTGALNLDIQVRALKVNVIVITTKYLIVPPDKAGEVERCIADLQWLSGFARMLPVQGDDGVLQQVEVGCILPKELVNTTSLQKSIESVIMVSVRYAPYLMALVEGLPMPPKWPEGKDPAMGLDWNPEEGQL